MSSAFRPPFSDRLAESLLQRLNGAVGSLERNLPLLNERRKDTDVSASLANNLLEDLWALSVYPEWAPVRSHWSGPTVQKIVSLSKDVLSAWDDVCERIRASGGPLPYYTHSAGVRAATLRRAGLGLPLESLTPTERESIRATISKDSPFSNQLAPAIWHAHALGLSIDPAVPGIRKVPAPKMSDKDFKPHFTRVLFSVLCTPSGTLDLPRLRQDIASCAVAHYAWVAQTGVDSTMLSFVAAFAAGLSECIPGLLPGPDLVTAVRHAISPDGVERLRQ